MNYRNWFSKELITNNDEFCFKTPITKSGHFKLVFTQPGYIYQLNLDYCIRRFISPCVGKDPGYELRLSLGFTDACTCTNKFKMSIKFTFTV